MPLLVTRLSSEQLARRGRGATRLDLAPYRDLLAELSVGEGALVELEPGETARVAKRRLTMAAGECGYRPRWLSAPANQLRFQLRAREETPQRRQRRSA